MADSDGAASGDIDGATSASTTFSGVQTGGLAGVLSVLFDNEEPRKSVCHASCLKKEGSTSSNV